VTGGRAGGAGRCCDAINPFNAEKPPSTRCSFVKATYLALETCESRALRQGLVIVDKTVEIVILAMVAAFLGLRLISVLGRRAEHEDQPLQPRLEPKGDGAPRNVAPDLIDRGGNGGAQRPILPGITPAIERGLKEVALTDKRFDAFLFLEGAKGAYRMVLEAFWSGDKETLAKLCDPSVLETFEAAIAAREAAGEKLENRLVRINEAEISAAGVEVGVARITVRFTADIAAVTRNAAGEVIAGSLTDAIEARDQWTFARAPASATPDWLLDETDEV
jgi:predicted lipid-binding transport protein (Tim44 family)